MRTVAVAVVLGLGVGCSGTGLRGAAGSAALTPAALDFGDVTVGKTATLTLDVENQGAAMLSVTSVQVSAGAGEFAVDVPAAARELRAGASCRLSVHFTPGFTGRREADYAIAFADGAAPLSFHVRGAGVLGRSDVSPLVVDFGNVPLGGKRQLGFALTNTSGELSYVTVERAAGTDAAMFSVPVTGELGIPARDGGLGVAVEFAPARLGPARASVDVRPCVSCATVTVQLAGTGVAAVLAAAPLAVDFGVVDLGVTATRDVTLTNLGNVSVSLIGQDALVDAAFASPAKFPLEVLPGGSQKLGVSFTPSALGAHDALLYLHDTAGPDVVVSLHGQGGGPVAQVRPTSVDFGAIAVGTSSQRRVAVVNVGHAPAGQTAPLTVKAVRIVSGAEFHVDVNAAPVTVALGGQTQIAVTYSPLLARDTTGTLELDTDDGAHPTLTVALSGSGRSLPPCQYVATPNPLQFGNVPVGQATTLAFAIENRGAAACAITNLALSGATPAAFSLPNGGVPQTMLAPGARLVVNVAFAPGAEQEYVGAVEYYVSDPANPQATIGLVGKGLSPCLTVQPPTLAFGALDLSCGTETKTATITNSCSGAVGVPGVVIGAGSSSAFHLAQPFAATTLQPGQSTSVQVAYTPSVSGSDAAPLLVSTTLGPDALTVGLTGSAMSNARALDQFDQAAAKMDILFVMDNSGSMTEERNALLPNLDLFWNLLTASGVDYHLGVTTTGTYAYTAGWTQCPGGANGGENGRLFPVDGSSPRIIDQGTPNGLAVLKANLNVGMCHWDERFLEPVVRAVASPLATETKDPGTPFPADGNAGFLRDDAKLALLVVTDANDDDDVANPPPVKPYYDQLLAAKHGHNDLLAFSGLVALQRCATSESVGTRYVELAGLVGTGHVEDSCDLANYDRHVTNMTNAILQRRTVFPLSQTPTDPKGVTVTVNGAAADPSTWSYDATTNSVVFSSAAAPPYASHIVINYAPGCH